MYPCHKFSLTNFKYIFHIYVYRKKNTADHIDFILAKNKMCVLWFLLIQITLLKLSWPLFNTPGTWTFKLQNSLCTTQTLATNGSLQIHFVSLWWHRTWSRWLKGKWAQSMHGYPQHIPSLYFLFTLFICLEVRNFAPRILSLSHKRSLGQTPSASGGMEGNMSHATLNGEVLGSSYYS